MSFPPSLPDWLPWWGVLLGVLPVAVFVLAFLAMPFSVLGVKTRLEAIEERLDEIQGEVRALSLRLPEQATRAPMPPVSLPLASPPPHPVRTPESRPRRSEPRLDWPQ